MCSGLHFHCLFSVFILQLFGFPEYASYEYGKRITVNREIENGQCRIQVELTKMETSYNRKLQLRLIGLRDNKAMEFLNTTSIMTSHEPSDYPDSEHYRGSTADTVYIGRTAVHSGYVYRLIVEQRSFFPKYCPVQDKEVETLKEEAVYIFPCLINCLWVTDDIALNDLFLFCSIFKTVCSIFERSCSYIAANNRGIKPVVPWP